MASTETDVDAQLSSGEINAENCNLSIKLPDFSFGFILPTIALPNLLDLLPTFGFSFSCDPNKPIDISGGLPSGGGRNICYNEDDQEELI